MIIVASCGHNANDERIYHKQINTLKKTDHSIIYFSYSNTINKIDNQQIIHYHFNSKKYSQSNYKKQLLKFIKNHNPHILHIHDLELLSVAYKSKQNNKNIKIIYDVHEDLIAMWDALSKYSGLVKKIINNVLSQIELYYLNSVDHFIIANKFADQNRYKQFGPVSVIQNFPKKNQINNKLTIKSPYRLIYHGQLDYNRGIITLINVFNSLVQKYNNLELQIIGQCRTIAFEKYFNKKIQQNNRIQFIPYIPHHKIWTILYDSHIGIIPFYNIQTFQKNTPTKLFEFMASNCAIVASDLKPIRAFASKAVKLVKPDNEESLFNAIEFYLNNLDIYKENILYNSEMIQKQYNWEIEEKKLLTIYRQLI
tara:strand:+ start:3205 stop:4305 length:1101 start_codon:yes stop_codon:yes gene_type:complete